MKFLLTMLPLTLVILGCSPHPPKPPAEDHDAARGATCASACENLRAHDCSLGKPTPRGASCEKVCENVRDFNGGAGFAVGCMTEARTCAIAEACR